MCTVQVGKRLQVRGEKLIIVLQIEVMSWFGQLKKIK